MTTSVAASPVVGAAGRTGLGGLASTWDVARHALADPYSNPQLSMIIVAIVAVACIMAVLLFVLMLLPKSRRGAGASRKRGATSASQARPAEEIATPVSALGSARPASAKPKRRRKPNRLVLALSSPLSIAVLLGIVAVGAYVTTSTDMYCAQTCHASSSAIAHTQSPRHASCVSCHEQPGVLGVVDNVSTRSRMLVVSLSGTEASATAAVSVGSEGCLRCHSDVASKVIVARGVRMSHAEPLRAGQPCTACHPGTGHSARSFAGGMASCVVCHDGKTASAECGTCHVSDPARTTFASNESTQSLGSGRIVYPAVRAAERDCSGCHNLKRECDSCHGVRMPHTDAFITSGHARAAAFDGKLVCYRCHDRLMCAGCHTGFQSNGDSAHGPNWKTMHQRAPWNSGCACHSGRTTRTAPICTLCHDPKTHALLPATP